MNINMINRNMTKVTTSIVGFAMSVSFVEMVEEIREEREERLCGGLSST